jgi:hypothetical protein
MISCSNIDDSDPDSVKCLLCHPYLKTDDDKYVVSFSLSRVSQFSHTHIMSRTLLCKIKKELSA